MHTLYIYSSFREIFDSKVEEYQKAQKVKMDKEIEELVERYVAIAGVVIVVVGPTSSDQCEQNSDYIPTCT